MDCLLNNQGSRLLQRQSKTHFLKLMPCLFHIEAANQEQPCTGYTEICRVTYRHSIHLHLSSLTNASLPSVAFMGDPHSGGQWMREAVTTRHHVGHRPFMKAPLLGTLSSRHLLCPTLHRGGDPKTIFFSEPILVCSRRTSQHEWVQWKTRRVPGSSNPTASHLHLFRKLSMLLFFLRAGKSRSYTSASRPSCGERRGVNTRALEAAASTGGTSV